jgi:hypothetical protein
MKALQISASRLGEVAMGGVALHSGVECLGHSTYTLTLDVYRDYMPDQDGGAANTLPEPPAPERPAETMGDNVVRLRRRG